MIHNTTRSEVSQMNRKLAIMSNDYDLPYDVWQMLTGMITNSYGIATYIAHPCYHSGFNGKPELIAEIVKKSLSSDEAVHYSKHNTTLIAIFEDKDNNTYNIKGSGQNIAVAIGCNQGLVKSNNKTTTYRLKLSPLIDKNTLRYLKLIPEKATKALAIHHKLNKGISANRGCIPDRVIKSVDDMKPPVLDDFFGIETKDLPPTLLTESERQFKKLVVKVNTFFRQMIN